MHDPINPTPIFDASDLTWGALTYDISFQGIHAAENCKPMMWVQVDCNFFLYEYGDIDQMLHAFRSAYLLFAS